MPFGRSKSTAAESTSADPVESDSGGSEAGKGRPTPKRADARKARRMAGTSGGAAGRGGSGADARARARAERQRQREALLTGDERNLPPRDAGPEKRLARDVIDAKWTVGQIFILVVFVEFVLAAFVDSRPVQEVLNLAGPISLLVIGVDSYRHGRAAKNAVAAKFGAGRTQGVATYAFVRAMLPRRFRRPPPKVARGGTPL